MKIQKRKFTEYLNLIGLDSGGIKNYFACLFLSVFSVGLIKPIVEKIENQNLHRPIILTFVILLSIILYFTWKSVPKLDFLELTENHLCWRIALHSGLIPTNQIKEIRIAGIHLLIIQNDGSCKKMKNCAARFQLPQLREELIKYNIELINEGNS